MRRTNVPGILVTSLIPNTVRDFPGTTDSQWGTADVLVKASNLPEHPHVVVNEFICNRLAVALGLPCPAGDIWVDADGVAHWVSLEIKKGGITLAPPTRAIVRRLPEFDRALIVYFDAMIGNPDRTEENILAASRGRYWLIDHDMALFGDMTGDNIGERLLSTVDRPLASTTGTLAPEIFPGDTNARGLAEWRVKNISEKVIAQAVQPMVSNDLLTASDAKAVKRYLKERSRSIDALVPVATGRLPLEISGGLFDWGKGDRDDS